jgi:hypothetical protein
MSHSESVSDDSDISSVSSDIEGLPSLSSDGTSLDEFVFAYDTANDHVEEMSPHENTLYELDIRGIIERGGTIGAEVYQILKGFKVITDPVKDQLSGLLEEAKDLSQFELQAEVKISFIKEEG